MAPPLVAGIIALLVTILTPTLGRAMELARRSICGANLNTVGKGIHIYLAEYERFPLRSLYGNPLPTLSSSTMDDDIWDSSLTDHIMQNVWLLIKAGTSEKAFECPSDDLVGPLMAEGHENGFLSPACRCARDRRPGLPSHWSNCWWCRRKDRTMSSPAPQVDPSSPQEAQRRAARLGRLVVLIAVCTCAFCIVVAVVQTAIVEKTGIFRDVWPAVSGFLAGIIGGGLIGHRLGGGQKGRQAVVSDPQDTADKDDSDLPQFAPGRCQEDLVHGGSPARPHSGARSSDTQDTSALPRG
ncbi:hypothetical protein LCGC14_1321430 [marine sediment metagenome]|uniref:DUF1559 domain-containing protein n=1 Tax=marine sediment metagenome TaxID=412755 RepID=A0A0F9KJX2_9ZZZZ